MVKVKALSWRIFCSKSGNCSAETPFGEYVIQARGNGDFDVWHPGNDMDANDNVSSFKAAEAHCQKHFESLVKQCLIP